jgi:hypothetical protein
VPVLRPIFCGTEPVGAHSFGRTSSGALGWLVQRRVTLLVCWLVSLSLSLSLLCWVDIVVLGCGEK